MDVGEVLKPYSKLIDREMDKRLPSPSSTKRLELKEFYEMIADYGKRGGKRLRPFLCINSCECFGGKQELAYPSATALEFFQNFVLIHDDIEDGSELRRGKPVLHLVYGIPKAINAGDALFYKMWETVLDNYELIGAEKTRLVEKEFCNLLHHTLEGQAIELNWNECGKCDITESDYFNMIESKTAWYTVATPCRIGAIIAGASEKHLKALVDYGVLLGKAFQIQDDLLNLIAETDEYGKEALGDIYEGKRTLMLVHLLQHCSAEEKKKVEKLFCKKRAEKKRNEVEEVFHLMKKYGSLEYAKAKAAEFAIEAGKVFDKEFADVPGSLAKNAMVGVTKFVVTRKL